MKFRKHSAFAKLTDDQCEKLLAASKCMTLEQLVDIVKGAPEPIHCSLGAMRKFLKRLEKEEQLELAEENAEIVEDLSKRANTPALRDATLQAMRERTFEVAFESNNRELLMEIYESLIAEKKEERAMELEERKVKVAEENAKIGWRKLEYEQARAGLKALPRIRELLMDSSRSTEDRVAGSLQLLMQMDAAKQLLLAESKGEEGAAPEMAAIPMPASMEVERAA